MITNGTMTGVKYGIVNSAGGTITITGGNITGPEFTGIYNVDNGTINISNGTITGESHGVYNDAGGEIIISGGDIIGAKSSAIYNNSSGHVKISSGTITGTYGIIGKAAEGIITIGDESATLSTTNPCIQGTSYVGISTKGTLNFYNGVIKSPETEDTGYAFRCTGTLNLRPGGYVVKTILSESIYSSILGYPTYTITLDSQGATTQGTVAIYEKYKTGIYLDSGCTKEMTTSTNAITVPTNTGAYLFGGYYTEANGSGTQIITPEGYITSSVTNTYFTKDTTIYAYWVEVVARINTTYYTSLQAAFDAVPTNGGETTVYLLRDTEETTKVISGQNIILQLDGNTVSSSSGSTITNNGTLKIVEGTIEGGKIVCTDATEGTYADTGYIASGIANFNSLQIESGNIEAVRSAVSNFGTGSVIIKGGTFTTSKYATIGNHETGTVTIEGGYILGTGNNRNFEHFN